MKEKIASLQETIRQVCLNRDVFKVGGANYRGVRLLCQQLVASINSVTERDSVIWDLPFIAREIVYEQYNFKEISNIVNKISSMQTLLDALSRNFKLRDQIINACAKKLPTYIETAGQLQALLYYADKNTDLYSIIERLESKLDSVIKSVGELNSILKMLPEESIPTLGKDLIKKFAILFETQEQLLGSLYAFSKSTYLQEALIETLSQNGRLANLTAPGNKKAILNLFENRDPYYEIIKKACKSGGFLGNFVKFRGVFAGKQSAVGRSQEDGCSEMQFATSSHRLR